MFPIADSIPAKRFPFINIILIGINIFVFIQELLSSNFDTFIGSYALIPSHVNFSDMTTLYPFVTAMFLHGGFLHILSNMWFLWIFGDNVEGYLGTIKYLFLYFFAGIFGNLVQFFLMPHSSIPMLGASGAIAGVLGAYYVMFPRSKIKTIIPLLGLPLIVDISATIMLGYWFVLQIFSGIGSFATASSSGGVAFFAHIGGFVSGLIVANLLKQKEESYA